MVERYEVHHLYLLINTENQPKAAEQARGALPVELAMSIPPTLSGSSCRRWSFLSSAARSA